MQFQFSRFKLFRLQRKVVISGLFVFIFHTCIIKCIAQAPTTRINIQLLGPDQGLPSRNIRTLAQDGRGFMWVGTGQDLWRYDGYIFQNFTAILTRSIKGRTLINQMRTAPNGDVWVAHNNGISIIDPNNFTCTTIDPSRYLKKVDTKQNLNIFFDTQGNAWVAISAGRLIKMNSSNGPVALYTPPYNSKKSSSNRNIVTKLFSDAQRHVYAYNDSSFLEVIDEKANSLRRIDLLGHELPAGQFKVYGVVQSGSDAVIVYYKQQGHRKNLMRKYFFKKQIFGPVAEAVTPIIPDLIYPDTKGHAWYESEKEIGFVNQKTGKFTNITTRLKQKSGADIFFFTAFLSSDDSFWISCIDGLFKITLTEEVFRKYLSLRLEKPGDIGSSIRGITQDSSGKIWASSYGFPYAGRTYLLHQIDPLKDTIKHLKLRRPKNIPGDEVLPYKLLFSKDQIYAVTDGTQLLRINPANLEYRTVEFPFVSGRGFTAFYKLNAHTFWMGTWGGMGVMNTRDMKPVLLNDKPGRYIKNERVNQFIPWSDNRILASTNNGLYVLNQDASIKEHYGQEPDDKIKLPALQIFYSINFENALWAATTQGLMRIDTARKKTRLFTTEDGLPDNNIYAALPDERGNLWLSTNKGISRLNTRTQRFYNYGLSEGLPHLEFNHGSYLKSTNGTLYFGGLNGIIAFDP